MSGDQQDRKLIVILMKQRHQVNSITAGHTHVAQDNPWPVGLQPISGIKGLLHANT